MRLRVTRKPALLVIDRLVLGIFVRGISIVSGSRIRTANELTIELDVRQSDSQVAERDLPLAQTESARAWMDVDGRQDAGHLAQDSRHPDHHRQVSTGTVQIAESIAGGRTAAGSTAAGAGATARSAEGLARTAIRLDQLVQAFTF